jgi:hypothetical protein
MDCDSPSACPSIPAYGEILIPWRGVGGFTTARTEYWVFWTAVGRDEHGSVTVSTAGVVPEP